MILKVKHDEVWKSINSIQQLLRAEEVNILERDYSTFDSVKIDTQLMNERMDHLDPTFIKILKNEIGSHSDWRWAGLELNPQTDIQQEHLSMWIHCTCIEAM